MANRDGGNVRRLTSCGHEEKPSFSPDGSQIAFTGDYDGTHGAFVVSAAGGEPRRLTYHPADADVQGWTPDGKRILFSSLRTAFASGVIQLFTVPLEGGFATQVPLVRAAEGSISPDGARIAYVPNLQLAAGLENVIAAGKPSRSGSLASPTPAFKQEYRGIIPMIAIPCGSATQFIFFQTAMAR